MSGSSLRRIVPCLLVAMLLLPMANAFAAPVRGREAARIELPDWSRVLLQPLGELLSLFRSSTDTASMPPGHKPGNGDGDGGDGGNGNGPSRDGSGLDPHGKP